MQIIPLQAVQNQALQVQLAGQPCQINIYQLAPGLFADLYVAGALIIGGVICENVNRIVRSAYLGFVGDLIFIDTQGSTDPIYTGLGARYQLAYLSTDDLVGAG